MIFISRKLSKFKEEPSSFLLILSIILLALPLAIILPALLYRSFLHVGIFLNEGYNTGFVQRFILGLGLYPEPSSGMTNNYTPLGFLIFALFSYFTGDIVFCGRIVSWFSFIGLMCSIFYVIFIINRKIAPAVFGALLFASLIALRSDIYIGSIEPQMTGHLFSIMSIIFVVIGEKQKNKKFTVFSAILVTASIFVKQNLLAVPAAISLWLAWGHSPRFKVWVGTGAILGVASMVASFLAFGHSFIAGVAAERHLDPVPLWRNLVPWIVPIEIPLLVATLIWIYASKDRYARLLSIQLACAAVFAIIQTMAEGVGRNALFDLFLAVSLSAGYVVGRPQGDRNITVLQSWLAASCGASMVLATVFSASSREVNLTAWLAYEHRREETADKIIEILGKSSGRAICETDETLCYWGGHLIEFDIYNYSRDVRLHLVDPTILAAEIRQQRFQMIQRQPEWEWPDKRIADAVNAAYRPIDPTLPDSLVPLPGLGTSP
jgi:hypothetical protein